MCIIGYVKKTANGFMTPYEFIHGDAPHMEYFFRIFGCKAYVRESRVILGKIGVIGAKWVF